MESMAKAGAERTAAGMAAAAPLTKAISYKQERYAC